MKNKYIVGVSLSKSINKNHLQRPYSEENAMTPFPANTKLDYIENGA